MLKLSTNCRYGTRILVFLASIPQDKPARRKAISEAEGISSHYVEQILLKLRSAGLIKALRGAKGGFFLAKDPENISIADVIEATEGAMNLAPCEPEECKNRSTCVTRPVWKKATKALNKVFTEITIAQMAENRKNKNDTESLMFNI